MKKKLFTVLLSLFAMLTATWAQDDAVKYGIQVGEVQVTSANAANITNACITKGKASFDAATYTLTLDGVTIENVNENVYGVGLSYYANGEDAPALTIKLVGKNEIPFIDVWHDESCRGKVTIVGADASASLETGKITDYMTDLCFSNCTVKVTAEGINISDSMTGCTLSVENATLDVTNKSGEMAIRMMGMDSQLLLSEGLGITVPTGGVFGGDPDGRIFTVFTGEGWLQWAAHVVIGPKSATVTDYGITLGGVGVNSNNADNITGECITKGKAWFDPETYTLTLDNVTVENINDDVIFEGLTTHYYGEDVPTPTIKLIGKNVIGARIFFYSQDVPARVNVVGADASSSLETPWIEGYQVSPYFTGCTTTVTTNGIMLGDSEKGVTLGVDNATLDLTGTEGYIALVITGQGAQLQLGEGIGIIEPVGGVFSDGVIFTDDTKTTEARHVIIGPKQEEKVTKYNLVVGGVQVTSENASNITGPGIVEGKASFDAETSTLTLDNVHFDMSDLWNWDGIQDATDQGTSISIMAVEGEVDALVNDLTINLIGTNISEDRGLVVRFFENVTITSADGNGVLKAPDEAYAGEGNQCIIDAVGNLTVSNCYVRCHNVGIEKSLTVTDGGTLETQNVTWFDDLNLGDGIGIIEPTNAKTEYKEYLGYSILNADGSEPSNIMIGPKKKEPVTEYNLWVGDVQVTSENASNITGDYITSGTASFDEETSTLTLRNIVIDEVTAIAIADFVGDYKPITDLTINLIGTNVSQSYECGTYVTASQKTNIRFVSSDGTGEMNFYIKGADDELALGSLCVLVGANDVTIDHCTVRMGMADGGGGVLTVTNGGTLGAYRGTFRWFSDLVMGEGIGIITPTSGATYHDEYLDYTGDEVVIGPKQDVEIKPITGDEEATVTIAESIDEETDLANNEVDNILFTLNESEGDGYDPTDESVVIGSTTTTELLNELLDTCEPGSTEFANGFNGITFLLPRGQGSVNIDCRTIGDRRINVKVGSNDAVTFTRGERGMVTVYYDCSEETYVYIYATGGDLPARALRRFTATENALKIYGITVKPGEADGINTVAAKTANATAIYNLQGQRVERPAKGIYIQGRRKVAVK